MEFQHSIREIHPMGVQGAKCHFPLRNTGLNAVILAGLIALASCFVDKAWADFRLCNKSNHRVGVAVGYKSQSDWITEGWWNVAPNSCKIILDGDLTSRYYYIHAIDYDEGGDWGGDAYMCTKAKAFTISGVENCEGMGAERTRFMEVDTKNERDWTVKLTLPDNGR